ncbi:MAG: ATP-binding protein [Synergistaceae bacterium]|nr:ATP-binding protein [Synergistaceae bacterium]
MKEFGRREYHNVLYLNFDEKPGLSGYFEQDLDPHRIIRTLSVVLDTNIDPNGTLMIFDEIQESDRALNSLKYFYENAPQYCIVAAGSFLGVATHGGFPVGKVDRLTLYPMTFCEFLEAMGKEAFADAVKQRDFPLIDGLAADYENLLKTYFYVGGMPKVVDSYVSRGNTAEISDLQNAILADYNADFSKHINPVNIPKVRMIWNSIPTHLAREKKKFIYKDMKPGARAYAFEDAMNWLFETRLVYKVSMTTNPALPLARNTDREAFKLYMLDIGLLGAKSGLDIKSLFEPNHDVFGEFKGALTEQFVCQELQASGICPLFYWTREKGAAEVDFLLQFENEAVPVEAKSNIHTKSKSLVVYIDEYHPARAVRTSLKKYGVKNGLYSIPLYMLGSFADILRQR